MECLESWLTRSPKTNPVPNQQLTLTVPKELQIKDSPTQSVPAGAGERTVTWTVRVLEADRMRVAVASVSALWK